MQLNEWSEKMQGLVTSSRSWSWQSAGPPTTPANPMHMRVALSIGQRANSNWQHPSTNANELQDRSIWACRAVNAKQPLPDTKKSCRSRSQAPQEAILSCGGKPSHTRKTSILYCLGLSDFFTCTWIPKATPITGGPAWPVKWSQDEPGT